MAAVNAKVIEELRALEEGGTPGLLRELIDLFLGEAENHLGRLRSSLAARDAQTFERAAHTLKGSSGNLGALEMSRICGELQGIGRAVDWSRATALLPVLEAEFRLVRGELEAEKARA